jgi:peptide/nickel transport system permease protein
MARFVVERLAAIVPILLGVSIGIFLLLHLAPGDVTQALLGMMGSEQAKENLRRALGLDQPLPVQYVKWLIRVLHGDFGLSLTNKQPVSAIAWPRFLNTALLAATSATVAFVSGFLIGIFAASRANSVADRACTGAMLVLGSLPPYWLGLLLVLLFSIIWRWFPATGMVTIGKEGSLLDLLRHLVLPTIATAAAPAAVVARMVRASMLEVLRQDYIRVARARGAAQKSVLWRHALRNALPPIATICGLQLGYLLGGVLFTEVVFAWPGIGNQLYYSIVARDIPTVQAAALLTALSFVLVNLLADLINAWLDPRIRRGDGTRPA